MIQNVTILPHQWSRCWQRRQNIYLNPIHIEQGAYNQPMFSILYIISVRRKHDELDIFYDFFIWYLIYRARNVHCGKFINARDVKKCNEAFFHQNSISFPTARKKFLPKQKKNRPDLKSAVSSKILWLQRTSEKDSKGLSDHSCAQRVGAKVEFVIQKTDSEELGLNKNE